MEAYDCLMIFCFVWFGFFFENHGFSNVAKSEKKDVLISTLQD